MSATTDLIVQPQDLLLTPDQLDQRIAIIKQRYEMLARIHKELMKKDVHYGKIPGTDKPTLLKAGAEMLCALFQLESEDNQVAHIEDWDNPEEPFIMYRIRYRVTDASGRTRGVSEGICHTKEKKYRYRGAGRVCPRCSMVTIRRGKYPAENPGWYCNQREGGCGSGFDADELAITRQSAGRLINPDIPDLANTCLKIAHKRGHVGATMMATMASEFFVDVEELPPGDDTHDDPPESAGDNSGGTTKPSSRPSRPQPTNVSSPPSQPAQPAGARNTKRVISEAQHKRFWGKVHDAGSRSKSDVEETLYALHCVDENDKPDSRFITVDIYDRLCAWAEGGALTPSQPQQPQTLASQPRRAQQGGMFGGGR
jgi:hypothetical protein